MDAAAYPKSLPDLIETEPSVVHLQNARHELWGRVINRIPPKSLSSVLKLAQVFPERLSLILRGDPTRLPHFAVFHPQVVSDPKYVHEVLQIFIDYGSDMSQQIVVREGRKESRIDVLTLIAKCQCEAQRLAKKNPSAQRDVDIWVEIRAMVLDSIQKQKSSVVAANS